MPFKNIDEYGRKRANPEASTTNFIHLPECGDCGSDDINEICETAGVKAATSGVSATGVIIDGVTTSFDTPILMSDVNKGGLAEAIGNIVDQVETDPAINVRYDDGELSVSHWGYLKLEAVVMSSGGNLTTTEKCTVVQICDFKAAAVGVLDLNGEALANNPYAYTSGDASANNTAAAAIKTDLETELASQAIAYESVTVNVVDSAEGFELVIKAVSTTADMTVQDKTFMPCNCAQAWAA